MQFLSDSLTALWLGARLQLCKHGVWLRGLRSSLPSRACRWRGSGLTEAFLSLSHGNENDSSSSPLSRQESLGSFILTSQMRHRGAGLPQVTG